MSSKIDIYEHFIEILDVMIHEISTTTLEDVVQWRLELDDNLELFNTTRWLKKWEEISDNEQSRQEV